MSQFEYKQFYTRNRPHKHPPDSVLFVTFRLAGSVPKAVLDQYRAERIWLEKEIVRVGRRSTNTALDIEQIDRLLEFHRVWFARFEAITDAAKHGPMWLGQAGIRQIVAEKLIENDGNWFRLDAFSIMSNHVHVVFKPNVSERNLSEIRSNGKVGFVTPEKTLAQIMQGIKGATAREANLRLERTGSFWEKESYDHYVRDDAEFHRVVKYTLNNPVKAGLVSKWQDWPGNYLAPRLSELYEATK